MCILGSNLLWNGNYFLLYCIRYVYLYHTMLIVLWKMPRVDIIFRKLDLLLLLFVWLKLFKLLNRKCHEIYSSNDGLIPSFIIKSACLKLLLNLFGTCIISTSHIAKPLKDHVASWVDIVSWSVWKFHFKNCRYPWLLYSIIYLKIGLTDKRITTHSSLSSLSLSLSLFRTHANNPFS
jgi:hypothetical protein